LEVVPSDRVAMVDGDIGEAATAARIVETALSRFHSLDALVNNAGVFVGKAFTDYRARTFVESSRRTPPDRCSCNRDFT
jgi:NADP-dependent 3-hydroxy acid dehydrogenase YdfG